jgi:hypothetical protein
MARKKKIPLPKNPNYTGLGSPNKEPADWVVQKSDPLQSLTATNLTLPEFKILDVYLSRIDSHDPEKRYVRFEKGEIEKLLGIEKINKSDLSKRLDNLFTAVTLRDKNKPKGFIKIGLFEKAECEQDEDGFWCVNLACTPSAMEYIFNIENLGYIRYKLRNVINLTSRYSYILFSYLLDNRYRKTWEISLNDLKSLLVCTAESYSEFKLFNDRILKKCKAEINAKTDIKFDYFTVKKGRKVTGVRFEIETMYEANQIEEQMTFDELPTATTEGFSYSNERLEFLAEACDNRFPEEEMRVIHDLVCQAVPSINKLERYDFLLQERKSNQAGNPIKQPFNYFKRMLEAEKNLQIERI